jgi:SM-20-related protein
VAETWLNPALRAEDHAAAYARDGMVQIENLLSQPVADALEDVLNRGTPWSLVHADAQGRHVILDPPALAAMPPADLRARLADVTRRAADAFSYLYLTYPMIDAYVDGRDPGHPLNGLTEFLNSPEFVGFAHAVTGETITKVDAQATLYRPGHFLTQHDDLGVGERRAAYTLGLTRTWRPDWGGQLMFHEPNGDIRRGLAPRFNVLTLFKVPLLHSVATVAPYAAAPRYTITGWLRDDPPAGQAPQAV